jgi:hypothetical protein
MTQTSQQLRMAKEDLAPHFRPQGPRVLKIGAALVFACGLALAPVPTFAQHGGGGGGGAHGGGGGGSHGGSGGGFGGGGSAAGSNGGGSHASGGSAGHSGASTSNSSGNSGGGHSWNPFHSSAAKPAPANGSSGVPAGNIKSESNATPVHFAAGNNTWQEPPHAGMSAVGRVNYYGPANVNGSKPFVPIATTTRAPMGSVHSTATVTAAQHPFQPIHQGYPYYPYYPYFGYNPYYGAFGFGFGGYGGCNPFWGCFGYGFGYGVGYGNGYGFGGGAGYFGTTAGGYNSGWTDAAAEGSSNVTSPDNTDSYLLAAPGTGGADSVTGSSNGTQELRTDAAPEQTYVLLYLKDGTSFAVSDYWLADGKLHYVTSYGGDNAVDESRVDLQRTVNENAARGVDFTLKPQAAGAGKAATATPEPAQNSEPQKPQ